MRLDEPEVYRAAMVIGERIWKIVIQRKEFYRGKDLETLALRLNKVHPIHRENLSGCPRMRCPLRSKDRNTWSCPVAAQ